MLRFDVDVTASDETSRTIEGVAVPYDGETAQLGGETYTFQVGSLTPARKRTPLLLGHSFDQPVGVLTELAHTDQGAIARFRIDEGPAGDQALIQASSGSRSGLSIGAVVDEADQMEDGTFSVSRASLVECSLVAVAAFASAEVTAVTAQADPADPAQPGIPADPNRETEAPTPEADPATQEDIMEAQEPQETPNAVPAVAAVPEPQVIASADDFAAHMVRAQRGNQESTRMLQAALSDLTTTTEPGLVPPAYVDRLLGDTPARRPIYDAVRKAPLPSSGMKIIKPIITTDTEGQWISEGDATPSNAFAVGTHEVQVSIWAYGVRLSLPLVERGEGAAETVFRRGILSWHRSIESALLTDIGLNAGDTVAPGADPVKSLAAGAAQVMRNNYMADLALVGPDTWEALIPLMGPYAFMGGSMNATSPYGTVAGLKIVATPLITGDDIFVLDSTQVEARTSEPVQLRVNVVDTLAVELGIAGFAAFDCEAGKAIVKVGTV
jgi:HK97 family phage prohead protease